MACNRASWLLTYILLTFLLHIIGIFSSYWVVSPDGHCWFGLLARQCNNDNGTAYDVPKGLDGGNTVLQLMSFFLMCCTLPMVCYHMIHSKDLYRYLYAYALVPFAGILSLSGCIIILAHGYTATRLGYSFYLSTLSGSLWVALTIHLARYWCITYLSRKKEEKMQLLTK